MQLNNCADQSQSLIQSVQWFVQTEHWISNFVIVHNSILRAILLSYILAENHINTHLSTQRRHLLKMEKTERTADHQSRLQKYYYVSIIFKLLS